MLYFTKEGEKRGTEKILQNTRTDMLFQQELFADVVGDISNAGSITNQVATISHGLVLEG